MVDRIYYTRAGKAHCIPADVLFAATAMYLRANLADDKREAADMVLSDYAAGKIYSFNGFEDNEYLCLGDENGLKAACLMPKNKPEITVAETDELTEGLLNV